MSVRCCRTVHIQNWAHPVLLFSASDQRRIAAYFQQQQRIVFPSDHIARFVRLIELAGQPIVIRQTGGRVRGLLQVVSGSVFVVVGWIDLIGRTAGRTTRGDQQLVSRLCAARQGLVGFVFVDQREGWLADQLEQTALKLGIVGGQSETQSRTLS